MSGLIKINKGEVYVVNQPKHRLISIVLVDTNTFPLVSRIHNSIDKLVEISDVFFIFSDFHYKSQTLLDKTKITSLYQACAFIDCDGKDLGNCLFKVFNYAKEIFNTHTGYLIVDLNKLDMKSGSESLNRKLLEINGSSIMKPVFKIRRLESDELYKIYGREREESETKDTITKRGLIATIVKIYQECTPEKVKEDELYSDVNFGINSCYTTNSALMYFRNGTINIFLTYYKNQKWKDYVSSFSYSSNCYSYLLPSLVKKLELDNLDQNIETLEFNMIKNNNEGRDKKK